MLQSDIRDSIGNMKSPGGYVFGVQGFSFGEQVPKSITFYLDGTATVSDQYGRPIKGSVVDGVTTMFATTAPLLPDGRPPEELKRLGTHAQVVAALVADRYDWQRLSCAGWPQLPYAELKKLPKLPETPLEELRKIKNNDLRRDALRARREADEAVAKESAPAEDE